MAERRSCKPTKQDVSADFTVVRPLSVVERLAKAQRQVNEARDALAAPRNSGEALGEAFPDGRNHRPWSGSQFYRNFPFHQALAVPASVLVPNATTCGTEPWAGSSVGRAGD